MYRVLLADDEQIERMALARRLMRRFGDSLQISEATNGKEAVELYQKEHSQIIIMDISMPELNGVEAAEQIRSMDEDCVIVFLTAYDEFSYAKRAIVIRALDYLLKPCDEEELAAVMEEAMRLTDKAVHNKENPTGNRAEMTEAEKLGVSVVRHEDQQTIGLVLGEEERDITEEIRRDGQYETIWEKDGKTYRIQVTDAEPEPNVTITEE